MSSAYEDRKGHDPNLNGFVDRSGQLYDRVAPAYDPRWVANAIKRKVEADNCTRCPEVTVPVANPGRVSRTQLADGEKEAMTTDGFTIKDSGERQEFSTGMVRDTQEGKPAFGLLWLKDLPYEEQFLTRWATHMAKGASKYSARNFELASTEEELERFKESASRHFAQWLCGETDEDHAAAVAFGLLGAEMVKWKMRNDGSTPDA